MKTLTKLALLTLTAVALNSSAQTFQKMFGGTGFGENAYAVQQTADGGYIVAGSANTFGAGNNDCYLIKLDSNGDTVWTRTYGGSSGDNAYAAQQTTDGGYIVGGTTTSWSAGGGAIDAYLIKTNSTGDTLWTKVYGGVSGAQFEIRSVQQTTDGGYILAGGTNYKSGVVQSLDMYVIKTDANGDTLWTKLYGGASFDRAYSIQQTTDGGYIIAGNNDSNGPRSGGFLVKINSTGDTTWTKVYVGPYSGEFREVKQTTDGGYVAVGYHQISAGADGNEYYMVKTDANGDTAWTKRYGDNATAAKTEEAYTVAQTSDGGYILGGGGPAGIIKTNSTGDTTWTRLLNSNSSIAYNMKQTADGGYIIAGYQMIFTPSYWYEVYAVKVDASGNGACNNNSAVIPTIRATSTTIYKGTTVTRSITNVKRIPTIVKYTTTDKTVVCEQSLPIELLSFDATPVKDSNNKYYVRCEWSTATEINNDYFTIERSQDGKIFADIGTKKGAGNSSNTLYYEFNDEFPEQGTSYYRLKQTDYDGKFSYSNIVPVFIGGIDLISIAPNPVIDNFEYKIGSTEKMSVQVKVVDILGQIVINKMEIIEKGITQKKLDISGISSGTYILELITENKEIRGKQFQIK